MPSGSSERTGANERGRRGVESEKRRVAPQKTLALHRAWVKLWLDPFRDLVLHPNQPRPTAAEAADEDEEEARAYYHQTHPPGYGR